MGLFSKEACAFCGKEVGAMHRTKVSGGDYLCTDCSFLTHPFIRNDKLNKEQVKALMEEMAQDEELFQSIEWDKPYDYNIGGKRFALLNHRGEDEFVIISPETAKYKNHAVFRKSLVRPYDKNLDWSIQQGNQPFPQPLSKSEIEKLVTLTEKKDHEGKTDCWVLFIPYFREHMNIQIKIPGSAKQNQLDGFVGGIRDTIGYYNASKTVNPYVRDKMQKTNAIQTASEIVKAAVKGESVEEIGEKLIEGIETANDINTGKVKRGLFGRLKK